MDFSWNAEQKSVIDQARRFAEKSLSDRSSVKGFDREGWNLCAAQSVFARPLPESWGGLGGGSLESAAVFEALGRGGADRGLLFAMGAHLFGCALAISKFGSPVQHAQYGTALADGSCIAALAITEPQGGTDLSNMQSQVTELDDGFRIEGTKALITNATEANVFLLIARHGTESASWGLSAFLVPRSTPGLEIAGPCLQAGLSGAPMARVSFHNVIVPKSALLGPLRGGVHVFSACMQWERSCLLAGFLGASERDLDHCVEYLGNRRDHAGPLSRHQVLAHSIARMKLRLDLARWAVYRAAWALDHDVGTGLTQASQAKLAASEAVAENALEAVRLLAGSSWANDDHMYRALIDGLGTLSASGSSEAQLNTLATAMGLKR